MRSTPAAPRPAPRRLRSCSVSAGGAPGIARRLACGRSDATRGNSMQLSDIDLLDRDRFTQGIPHEWFTFLRKEAPVYKHPEPDGPGFWVVSKYADVVTVGRDGTTYSSDQKRGGVVVLE